MGGMSSQQNLLSQGETERFWAPEKIQTSPGTPPLSSTLSSTSLSRSPDKGLGRAPPREVNMSHPRLSSLVLDGFLLSQE